MNAPRERRRPLDGAVNPNAETASQQGPVPDDEAARQERIAVAAYYRAERRGFGPGGEQDDWLQAESEIDGQHGSPRAGTGLGDADRMVPGPALPSGPASEPSPAGEKRAKKPDRRTRAR